MAAEPLYRPTDFGMVRTPSLPVQNSLPHYAGENVDDASEAELRDFLRAAAADPFLSEAIAVSSPSLAELLGRAAEGVPLRRKQLRKAVPSVARYVTRAGNRSTPFGLLAGFAPLSFGERTAVSAPAAHTKHVRVDGAWLSEIVHRLERQDEILAGLELVVNQEALCKGGSVHFYAEAHGDARGTRVRPARKSLRSQFAIDEILRSALRPIGCPALLDQLEQALPGQTRARLLSLVRQLVSSRMLLTSLRPPVDCPDLLEHVLTVLERMSAEPARTAVARLTELRERMRAYEAKAVGEGTEALAAVRETVRRIGAVKAPSVQVDLRLAERIRVPASVAADAAAAVDALWRMSPRRGGQSAVLRPYADRFDEFYGRDELVPLNDLLDPERGLGHPAGWAKKTDARAAALAGATDAEREEEQRRSATLAELAWGAGSYPSEAVLGDDTVARLARTSSVPPRRSAEVMFELMAASAAALDAGDYRLVMRGGSHQAAALFGRFGHLLPELDAPLREIVSRGAAEGVPVQLMSQAVAGFAYLVGGSPRWTEQVVRMGELPSAVTGDGTGACADHGPGDLLIGVRDGDFRVVCTVTCEELDLVQTNVMISETWGTPAVRLLCEISKSRGRPWLPWSWGEFESAPRLPRVRYGKSVLALGRWRADQAMVEAGGDLRRWQSAFASWRERYEVPDVIQVGAGDRTLVLDLTRPLHRHLLHEEVRKSPSVRIEETSESVVPGGHWLNGRAAELVVPLLAGASDRTSATVRPGRPDPAPPAAPGRSMASAAAVTYPVGSEWLYAKIYASAHLHDEILAETLPALLREVGQETDRAFFLRYRDPDDHLRLRLHGAPDRLLGVVLPALRDWAEELRHAGLAASWSLHAYRPETRRYGGPAVMAAAESVFHADSEVALRQLRLSRQKRGPLAEPGLLLGLNLVDIVREMLPGSWAEWLVDRVPRDPRRDHFRSRAGELRTLVDADRKVLAEHLGGSGLAEVWNARACELACYRHQLARHGDSGGNALSSAVSSLTHMHHNRAKGIDRESEIAAHAIARGFAELTLGAARRAAG